MKKAAVLILAVFYVAISSGMIVNLHYCMNRFSSADIGFVTKDDCGICGMDKSKSHGCCHDEIKLVKLQDDQNRTMQVAFDFTSLQSVAILPSLFISTSFYNADQVSHQIDHAPPLLTQLDFQSTHCIFRI